MNFDDPKLTAYALGELPEEECEQMARELAAEPAAQAAVETTRQFAAVLREAMQETRGEELTAGQRQAVLDELANRERVLVVRPRWSSPVLRLAMAAALVVAVTAAALWFRGERSSQELAVQVKVPQAEATPVETSPLLAAQPVEAKDFVGLEVNPADVASSGPLLAQANADKVMSVDSSSIQQEMAGAPETPVLPAKEIANEQVNSAIASAATSTVAANKSGIAGATLFVNRSSSAGTVGGSVSAMEAPGASRPRAENQKEMAEQRFAQLSKGPARDAIVNSAPLATPGNGSRMDAERESYAGYPPEQDGNTAAFDSLPEQAFLAARATPLSTFSIDVDTASYSIVRRFLRERRLPPAGAVRIEELVNYFPYDYPQPREGEPFSANIEAADCPWAPEHRLVRIGLKGRDIATDRVPSNLVFLIDVSGSMSPEDRLPLLKQSLRLLVEQLGEEDRVAIVVYAGNSGLVLGSTPGSQRRRILGVLDDLRPGGSTNGASGIQLAYQIATENFIEHGVNRVILATDGDFNVGVTSQSDLVDLIEKKAKSGVFLSVLGVGMDNLKDSTMEKLADKGNGNYAYLDSLSEGRKVLVEQMRGTLVTIAKDVKIQVEWNPDRVASYRLIGYENRALRKEDFNDDKKDAGEIGAGHTVTALYEVVPAGAVEASPAVDALKYQAAPPVMARVGSPEMLTLKLRWKAPDGEVSQLREVPFTDAGTRLSDSSRDFRWAAGVAGFGMLLRDSANRGDLTWDKVRQLTSEEAGASEVRREFRELVGRAQELKSRRE